MMHSDIKLNDGGGGSPKVLILVLMDDALRLANIYVEEGYDCLNPCFNG